jgi:hypothetical protein
MATYVINIDFEIEDNKFTYYGYPLSSLIQAEGG